MQDKKKKFSLFSKIKSLFHRKKLHTQDVIEIDGYLGFSLLDDGLCYYINTHKYLYSSLRKCL